MNGPANTGDAIPPGRFFALAASDSQTPPRAVPLLFAGAEDLHRREAVGLGYAGPRGAPWLRTAIAGRYDGLGPGYVLACDGARQAMAGVLRTLLGPDGHGVVLLPVDGSPAFAIAGLCAAGSVPLDPDRDWSLGLGRLRSGAALEVLEGHLLGAARAREGFACPG